MLPSIKWNPWLRVLRTKVERKWMLDDVNIRPYTFGQHYNKHFKDFYMMLFMSYSDTHLTSMGCFHMLFEVLLIPIFVPH